MRSDGDVLQSDNSVLVMAYTCGTSQNVELISDFSIIHCSALCSYHLLFDVVLRLSLLFHKAQVWRVCLGDLAAVLIHSGYVP